MIVPETKALSWQNNVQTVEFYVLVEIGMSAGRRGNVDHFWYLEIVSYMGYQFYIYSGWGWYSLSQNQTFKPCLVHLISLYFMTIDCAPIPWPSSDAYYVLVKKAPEEKMCLAQCKWAPNLDRENGLKWHDSSI